jgi:hypothetical protein
VVVVAEEARRMPTAHSPRPRKVPQRERERKGRPGKREGPTQLQLLPARGRAFGGATASCTSVPRHPGLRQKAESRNGVGRVNTSALGAGGRAPAPAPAPAPCNRPWYFRKRRTTRRGGGPVGTVGTGGARPLLPGSAAAAAFAGALLDLLGWWSRA